jgi:hypothetical protein
MVNMRLLTAVVSAAACFAAVAASPAPKSGPRQTTTAFWYSNIDHTSAAVRGYAPDLDPDYQYQVYKAVAPGANAVTIQAAINSGSNGNARHGKWLASQPRVWLLSHGTW